MVGGPRPGADPQRAGRAAYRGSLHLFVRGTDNRIYQNRLTGNRWSRWTEVPGGGLTTSGPAVTVHRGALYLAVRGTDNAVYVQRYDGQWRGWQRVPTGATPDAPAIVSYMGSSGSSCGAPTTASTGPPCRAPNQWSAWTEVPGGGLTPSGPGAVVYRGNLYLLVRGTNDGIFLNVRDPRGQWSGWTEVPGQGRTPSGPAGVRFADRLYLFVRGTDNGIYTTVRTRRSARRNQGGWPGQERCPGQPPVSGSTPTDRPRHTCASSPPRSAPLIRAFHSPAHRLSTAGEVRQTSTSPTQQVEIRRTSGPATA